MLNTNEALLTFYFGTSLEILEPDFYRLVVMPVLKAVVLSLLPEVLV